MEPDHISPTEVEQQSEKFPSQTSIPQGSDGWLAPDGLFYECTSVQHNECADFLNQKYKNDVKEKNPWSKDEELPSRTRLEKTGFVLVRNDTLPCYDFNLTSSQIDLLNQAKITIKNPETNTECNPLIIQNIIAKIKNYIPTIKKYAAELEPTEKKYYKGWDGFQWEGIEKFELSPLTTTLFKRTADFGQPAENIFNLLSSGYSDSIKIKTFPWRKFFSRDEYQIRIIPIPNNPNLFLYVQKHQYDHDGQSVVPWNSEYDINIRIKSLDDIEEELKKLTNTNSRTNNKNDYKDPEVESETDSPILMSLFAHSQLPKDEY
jgi:hypothetical protein